MLYVYEYRPGLERQLVINDRDGCRKFDVFATYRVLAGNVFSSAEAKWTARIPLGGMSSYFEGEGLPGRIESVIKSTFAAEPGSCCTPRAGWLGSREAFVYARVTGRFVAYNALIEGEMFGNDSPFVQDTRPWVVDTEVGFVARWRKFAINVARLSRSTEIDQQSWSLIKHTWMALSVSFYP